MLSAHYTSSLRYAIGFSVMLTYETASHFPSLQTRVYQKNTAGAISDAKKYPGNFKITQVYIIASNTLSFHFRLKQEGGQITEHKGAADAC